MRVKEVAYWPAVILKPEDTAEEAVRTMVENGLPVAPVVSEMRIQGLFAGGREIGRGVRVKDLMVRDFETLPAGMELGRALAEATLAGRTGWPVAVVDDEGNFCGFFDALAAVKSLLTKVAELKNQIKELDSIFNSTYDGICITDNRGTVLRLNKTFERLTGLKVEEQIGQNLYDLVREGSIIQDAAALRVLETGRPATILQKFSLTGKELMISGNPVFDEQGRIFRVVTNLRDITELRRLQEELRQTQELNAQYFSELERLRIKYAREKCFVFESAEMRNIVDLVQRVAKVEAPVLLLGESGVGKEIIATMLHELHPERRKYSLIKVNCGAIPRELMESEFFGYEPGAFTGASRKGKPGFFELAHRGTIFLDEIGELPLDLQVKLLRILQEQEVTRLGSTRPVKLDVRVVTATNRDIEAMVKRGAFREDLYYRINVVPIRIPALRERRDDIAPLLFHYLGVFNKKYGLQKSLSSEVVDCLVGYSWPGNVRELINLVERLVVTTGEQQITLENLPLQYRVEKMGRVKQFGEFKLFAALEEVEKQLVAQALRTHGSTYKAARALGVSQSTVVRLAKKYELNYGARNA